MPDGLREGERESVCSCIGLGLGLGLGAGVGVGAGAYVREGLRVRECVRESV